MNKTCTAALITAVLTAPALAQLTPPPGAITPSNVLQREADARTPINDDTAPSTPGVRHRIGAPGSYYLTRNLTVSEGQHGIEIVASDVTIDLNGFTIDGSVFFGGPSRDGISITSPEFRQNITVKNGTIRGFGETGVDLAQVKGVRFMDVNAYNNAVNGLAAGSDAVIDRCTAINNGNVGFIIGTHAAISNSTAAENGPFGFSLSTGCAVENCTASDNQGTGFRLGAYSTARNCSAEGNTDGGFSAQQSALVEGCVASANGRWGISAEAFCTVRHCVANSNGSSISFGSSQGVGIVIRFGGRAENNNCFDNDIGLNAPNVTAGLFPPAVLIGNTAGGSHMVNYDIGSGNVAHVVRVQALGSAIAGDQGGTDFSSSSPVANFAIVSAP